MKITTLITLGLASLTTAQITDTTANDDPPSTTFTDAFTADQGRCPPGCPPSVCGWICHGNTAAADDAAPKATLFPIPGNPNTIKADGAGDGASPTNVVPCPEGRVCDGPTLTTRPTTSVISWPTGRFHHPPGGFHSAPSSPDQAQTPSSHPIINKNPSRLLPPVQDFEESLPSLPTKDSSSTQQPGSQPYPVPDNDALETRPEDPHHVNNLDGRSNDNKDGIPPGSSYFNAPKPVVPTGQPTIPPWERSSFFEAPRPGVPTNAPLDQVLPNEVVAAAAEEAGATRNPALPTGQPTIPPWERSSFFELPRPVIPTKRAVQGQDAPPQSFVTVTRTVDAEPEGETSE